MASRAAPCNMLMRTTLPCSANAVGYHGLGWHFQSAGCTAAKRQGVCHNKAGGYPASPATGSRGSLVLGLGGLHAETVCEAVHAAGQGRGGEGLIVSSGTSGTAMPMIGHAIPYVQLIPSNFGVSLDGALDGALGEGFGPGLRLGS